MKAITIVKSLVCAGMLLAGSMASAALIVTEGVSNPGTDNVLSETCSGNIQGPALLVQGCLNSGSDFFVNFTTTTPGELLTYTGGQAVLVAVDGGFNNLTISLDQAGWTFSKIVLNINAITDGFVTFNGTPGGASSQFALGANGENFFTITGEAFSSLSFTTTVAVSLSDVRQVRLGGVEVGTPVTPVPEPGILMLMGLGLFGLGMGRKFKAKKA